MIADPSAAKEVRHAARFVLGVQIQQDHRNPPVLVAASRRRAAPARRTPASTREPKAFAYDGTEPLQLITDKKPRESDEMFSSALEIDTQTVPRKRVIVSMGGKGCVGTNFRSGLAEWLHRLALAFPRCNLVANRKNGVAEAAP